MKGWLCTSPVRLRVGNIETQCPPEAICLLGVFKTKKAGRDICGKDAEFMQVELNDRTVKQ